MRRALALAAAAAALLAGGRAEAGSIYFGANRPEQYDFADLAQLPRAFGRGEFTFELWVKPDHRFPVGETARGTRDQLTHWTALDAEPYSSHFWWLPGNWLLDGHSRPNGYGPGDSRAGTFSLQFYGGGRLRWMFADTKEGMPKGMVHAVQAWPATTTPSLLDGKWHHVVAVRRWREPVGATLELWIDGKRVAATDIPHRNDMHRFWDKLAHPGDPAELGGWALGAEVMTAWNIAFTQYEDYKGLIDDVRLWGRAPSGDEIAAWAAARPARRPGLLAHFSFDEGKGAAARDAVDPAYRLELHRMAADAWSREEGPGAK